MRTPLRSVLACLAVLVVGASCSSPTAPEELGEAVAVWERHGLTQYRMEITFDCVCGLSTPEPVRVRVVGDAIVAVHAVQTGAEVPPAPSGSWGWPTIDELFDLIGAAENEGRRVIVEYDAHFGHPTRATIGAPEMDAGYTMRVHRLTR